MKEDVSNRTSTDDQILAELKKINKILTLSNGQRIENELEKFASSNERKMIWVLIDGKRQSPDIAQVIKMTKRAVDMFLQSLEDAGLVEKRMYGKPPVRAIEYVPASWIDLLSKSVPAEEPFRPSHLELGFAYDALRDRLNELESQFTFEK